MIVEVQEQVGEGDAEEPVAQAGDIPVETVVDLGEARLVSQAVQLDGVMS